MFNRSGRTVCSLPGKFVNSMYEKKLICREFEVFD